MSASFRTPVPADLPEVARAIHLRRQLAQAAEHGVALLAAIGLPRLVTPDFVPLDPVAIGEALESTIAALDTMDGDPEAEPWLGWTAKVDQVHLGYDQDDHETTAPERHGRGFVRCGPDDAEDDDPLEHDFRSRGPTPILRPMVAHV